MYGKNPPLGRVTDGYAPIPVRELFYTLQGEGPYAGVPAVFLRLAGCPLRCHFCDTDFDVGASTHLTVPQIVERIIELYADKELSVTRLVVITGGEPMRFPLYRLILALNTINYAVHIETSGIMFPEDGTLALFAPAPKRLGGAPALAAGKDGNRIIVAPKTAKIAQELIQRACAYKYVIRAGEVDPHDGLPSVSTQVGGGGGAPWRPEGAGSLSAAISTPVYVNPCDDYDIEKNRANMIAARDSALKHGYRLGVQLHKLVGLL